MWSPEIFFRARQIRNHRATFKRPFLAMSPFCDRHVSLPCKDVAPF
jgi:hypothetical protein